MRRGRKECVFIANPSTRLRDRAARADDRIDALKIAIRPCSSCATHAATSRGWRASRSASTMARLSRCSRTKLGRTAHFMLALSKSLPAGRIVAWSGRPVRGHDELLGREGKRDSLVPDLSYLVGPDHESCALRPFEGFIDRIGFDDMESADVFGGAARGSIDPGERTISVHSDRLRFRPGVEMKGVD